MSTELPESPAAAAAAAAPPAAAAAAAALPTPAIIETSMYITCAASQNDSLLNALEASCPCQIP